MTLTEQARIFAIAAHSAMKQKRKYTFEDYWTHPEWVANRAWKMSLSDEAVAAAWLHDVLEDTGVESPVIFGLFGLKVSEYVTALTEDRPEGMNRAQRKALYHQKLADASAEVQNLKLLDSLHNLMSVMAFDRKFAHQYVLEKEQLLALLTKARPKLIAETRQLLDRWYATSPKDESE